jgi:flagellar P-ring protein precursor FlgI
VTTTQSEIEIKQGGGSLIQLKAGVNLADVVKAINALGAGPQDLLSILQSMKAAGACAPSWRSSEANVARPPRESLS